MGFSIRLEKECIRLKRKDPKCRRKVVERNRGDSILYFVLKGIRSKRLI